MPLIQFQTDLKSLPWGRDKRDGGKSKQPYVTKNIPTGLESDDLPVRSGPDFIVRGGLKAVSNAVDDVGRLGKFMLDGFSGVKFILKQNLLSRTAPKTPASFGLGYAGGGIDSFYFDTNETGLSIEGGGNINQGVYTPIGTLAQSLGNGLGLHSNLFGLDPFSPMSGVVQGSLFSGDLSINTYEAATKKFNETADGNRLVIINDRVEEVGNNPDQNIYSYQGGPGAILGIGRTNIKFADKRTGVANPLSVSNPGYFYSGGVKNRAYQTQDLSKYKTGADSGYAVSRYVALNPNVDKLRLFGSAPVTGSASGPIQNFPTSVNSIVIGDDGVTPILTPNPRVLYANNSLTFDPNQIITKQNVVEGGSAGLYPTDFRKELYNANGIDLETNQNSSVISLSPNYRTRNIDRRLFMGQPGKEGGQKRADYTGGKNVWNYAIPANELQALDKINAMPMYTGSIYNGKTRNDLCKFRITSISNNGDSSKDVNMHFRAFLDGFTDSYNATWNAVNYVGRGDTLYNYGGFGRSIELSFTVAAQSKAELIPMYKKLNYLASTLAPEYTKAGFMQGNLVKLTIGGYLYEQPGFITALTYTVPQETTWEIAIGSEGVSDSSVKELPHIIQVSGFSFTPIHTFLPSKPSFEEDPNNPNQKFIALSNNTKSSNYSDVYEQYEPSSTTTTADADGIELDSDNNPNTPG